MERVAKMAGRLPQLYRDGELLRGTRAKGGLLEVPALQLEAVDEELREVQRTHWFDQTYELEHAARLAALLDLQPEAWQELETFRIWVHALRDAMLQKGGLTVEAILSFVADYAGRFQAATGITLPEQDAELLEHPPEWHYLRYPAVGELQPLEQFTITNGGKSAMPLSLLITTIARAPEASPLLVNVTTGEALLYPDELPPGRRLWIGNGPDGLSAKLELEDVTAKLLSISGVVPGTPWEQAQVGPAKPMMLEPGENRFWFFPAALFDRPGLDRMLLTMPGTERKQGSFDATFFDHALFWQEPRIAVWAAWQEEMRAAFTVRIPAAGVRSSPPADPVSLRERLGSSVTAGIERLRAAGVRARVTLTSLTDAQPQRDSLRLVMPVILREGGPSGADRIAEHGGTFGVTSFNDSTFR